MPNMYVDHEYLADNFQDFVLGVDKVGGGIVGKGYTGHWVVERYEVCGKHVETIPVTTGMPYIHAAVADLVAGELTGEI